MNKLYIIHQPKDSLAFIKSFIFFNGKKDNK